LEESVTYDHIKVINQKVKSNAQMRELVSRAIINSKSLSTDFQGAFLAEDLEQTPLTMDEVDVFITMDEIVEKQGTGVLLKRIFKKEQNILTLRSRNHYNGKQSFGISSICFPLTGCSREESFFRIAKLLKNYKIRRVLCVPYSQEQLIIAITLREMFNVPLCTWIMDDQNITVSSIPNALMDEFLSKSSLRLATHPELRDAYEAKFGYKFWLLPAVAPEEFIQDLESLPKQQRSQGILIGSMWSKRWFTLLCEAVYGAGIKLNWYGQLQPFFEVSQTELASMGITVNGLAPEKELVEHLRNAAYVVVPTGVLDEDEDRPDIGQLSLPGRILFAMATSNTPLIILGSEKTSAASFVRRFGVGTVASYSAQSLQAAVEHITLPENQRTMRHNAAAVAKQFSSKDVSQWMWQSLQLGQPVDRRFEDLFGN
jgi:hypothetical protein